MKKRTIRKQFTLLELVIVLSFLSLMMFMVQAVAGQLATSAEKNTACQDNLRKFAQAATQYAADSDSFLPFPGLFWTNSEMLGKRMDAWISSDAPSKNIDTFMCPSDSVPMDKRQEGGNKFWSKLPDGQGGYVAVSYGINLVVTGMPNNQFMTPHRLKVMDNPKGCMLFADATARDIPADPERVVERHDGKANIAYADGRVADISKAAVPKFQSHLKQAFWVGGED